MGRIDGVVDVLEESGCGGGTLAAVWRCWRVCCVMASVLKFNKSEKVPTWVAVQSYIVLGLDCQCCHQRGVFWCAGLVSFLHG